MNSWFTPDGAVSVFTIFSLAGAGAGAWMRLYMVGVKKDHDAHVEAVKVKNQEQDKELQRMAEAQKAAWVAIDKLKEDRLTYLTRDDHEKWRQEIKADMNEWGARLLVEIDRRLAGRKGR